jgi:membrane fusion protein (multidrug efflux system)
MNDNNNENVQIEDGQIQNQSQQNKSAGKKIAIFLASLGIIGGGYFSYYNFYASKFEKTDNAYVNANQNILTSQVPGIIAEISVVDTQPVHGGYKAIQLEKIDFQIALDRAKNDLAKAVRGVKSLQINKDQNQENVQLKIVDFDKAKSDFIRDQKAFEHQVISKEQFDNSKYRFEQAKIALDVSKTNLKNSQFLSLSTTISEHPDVARAINFYKQAYIDYTRTTIIVPTDGVVAKKSAYIGQRIKPNQPLLSVIEINNQWVDANFKESQIEKLKIGQKVELHSDVNNKTYQGYIAGIGAGSGSALSLLPAQNATGNWIKVVQRVPVRINLLGESVSTNGTLPIGTSMHAKVLLEETRDVITNKPQRFEFTYNEEKLNSEIQKIISDNLEMDLK